MVGRGQCNIHARQPRTAIGQARARRSGLRPDQKKLSSRGEESADLVVDTGEGRARPPPCGPPTRTPAAGSGGRGRGNGSLFPFQQLKPQNKDANYTSPSFHKYHGRKQRQQMRQVRGRHTACVPCQQPAPEPIMSTVRQRKSVRSKYIRE